MKSRKTIPNYRDYLNLDSLLRSQELISEKRGKKAHDEIWPELSKLISDAGISMAIYKHGDLLFIHAIAPSEDNWNSIEGDVTEKWYEWMTEFLVTGPDGKTIVTPMPEAFSFGMFSTS